MRQLRIGMAQVDSTVGDFTGNTEKVLKTISKAKSLSVDIVTFPELALCGYPPEDLLLRPLFVERNRDYLQKVIQGTSGITAVVGFVDVSDEKEVHNAAAIIHDSKLIDIYHKIYLTSYGTFDERRYFQPGEECPVYLIGDVCIGVNIGEDICFGTGPFTVQARSGAEVLINVSASPYYAGRGKLREDMLRTRALDNATAVIYTNLVGGQDELVFDGQSMALDAHGRLLGLGKRFEEELVIVDVDEVSQSQAQQENPHWREGPLPPGHREWRRRQVRICDSLPAGPKPPLAERYTPELDMLTEIYKALVLGTRDYVHKNGFQKVVIGLSGGIDSSLVAVIAADALGPQNVTGVAMPSMYSSPDSIFDADLLARNLGIRIITIHIEGVFQKYMEALSEAFQETTPDVTEENIQARIRGNLLMALSNKFRWLVLTTGNKSEMATGYTTLYGDMAGGFAVIKDVPKTMVYQLARHRNKMASREMIPSSIIGKEPSAELKPEQRDTDTLPPYEELDPILTAYVEEDHSIEQIIASGFDEELVRHIASLVDTNEYKSRQAPPGINMTSKAFGRDRRLPITNRFKG